MRKGFTLLELIIVVIIIGILAMIAVPQFFKVAERGRAAEAINILGALRSAQLRYYSEHAHTTGNWRDLDMEISGTRFFDIWPIGSWSPSNNTNVARARRNGTNNPGYGRYYLTIEFDGDIYCSGGSRNICRALGY